MTESDENRNPIILIKNKEMRVDSRDVSDHFDKEHKSVLRAIRDLECSQEFHRRNFAPFKIKDLTGESTSHVEMTQDGFTFLVMGFTGKKAAAWKEKYIIAFNAMKAEMDRAARRVTVRENGKLARNNYTKTLQKHGVDRPRDYARATNSIYRGLWDKDAAALRRTHGLPDKCNVRNHMSEVGLAAAMLAEALSSERIVQTDRQGIEQCAHASYQCATHVRGAISAEKASRKTIGSPE